MPGQDYASQPNSAQAQAGALACSCPFCIIASIFLGMLLSPAINTLADDARACCGVALVRDCSQQAVWKKPTHFRKNVGENTHVDVSCNGEPLLIFVFWAREWALLALFVSIDVGLENNLLSLGCSCTWFTLFDGWILHNGRASSGFTVPLFVHSVSIEEVPSSDFNLSSLGISAFK